MKSVEALLCLFSTVLALGAIDRSLEIKYDIQIFDELVDTHLGEPITMVSPRDKLKYNCYLPLSWTEEDEKFPMDSDTSIESLLTPLKSLCLYKLGGWWSYEVCYGRYVRQYHQEKDKPILPKDDFWLGLATPDAGGFESEDYYSEIYEDGSVCDVNGVKRKTELRFVCDKDAIVSSITELIEPSSCKYLIVISTPLLCHHPLYRPKKERQQTIKCFGFGSTEIGLHRTRIR
eukprot:TRINITY_DN2176_c0_g1_i3.p1 TRINITY_DN2176_c0_g1~~TRINITY_DN2176_c0_g1_i3.p1  ORF type:complete len:232 (-),score=33.72 TRINITY_DN2176_c0_g1_i3:382-1077(-)